MTRKLKEQAQQMARTLVRHAGKAQAVKELRSRLDRSIYATTFSPRYLWGDFCVVMLEELGEDPFRDHVVLL